MNNCTVLSNHHLILAWNKVSLFIHGFGVIEGVTIGVTVGI